MSVRVCASVVLSAVVFCGASPALASDALSLVQRFRDPGTGTEVRVFRGTKGELGIELGDRSVRIRKELIGERVITAITTPTDRFRVEMEAAGITITTPAGRIAVTPGQAAAAAKVRELAIQSDAVADALAFLSRVNLGPRSPLEHIVLVTRAMLGAMRDSRGAGVPLARWVEATRQTQHFSRVQQTMGPSDCWNEYAKEAIAAATELEECEKNVKWWDYFGYDRCYLIYDMRAIGAFAWWLKCVSIT